MTTETCRRGHPRTPEHSSIRPDGYRVCRTCVNMRQRERRSEWTPEQREKANREAKERRDFARAAYPQWVRKQDREKSRRRRESLTPEQKERYLADARERNRRVRAKATAEQKAARLEWERNYMDRKPEAWREKRRAYQREYKRQMLASETPEEREARLAREREYKRRAKARGKSRMSSVERLDEWLFIVHGGEDPERAASRLGVSIEAIYRAAERHGRPEIVRLCAPAVQPIKNARERKREANKKASAA